MIDIVKDVLFCFVFILSNLHFTLTPAICSGMTEGSIKTKTLPTEVYESRSLIKNIFAALMTMRVFYVTNI